MISPGRRFKARTRALLTKEERQLALEQAHSLPRGGHYGVGKTFATMWEAAKVYWRGMFADVYEYVQACDACQRRSAGDLKNRAPMRSVPYPKHAARLIGADIKRMPDSRDGCKYIIVAARYYAKFPVARKLKSKEARPIADFFFGEIFRFCGYAR